MMTRFLLILLAWASPLLAADRVRYVDTGSAASGNGTTAATSSGDNTHAYQSWSACITAELAADADLTDEGKLIIHLNRTNGGGLDTTAVQVINFTESNTCYVHVIQDDAPLDGVFDDTRYVLAATDAAVLDWRQDYGYIDHVQIQGTVTTSGQGIYIQGQDVVGGSITVDGCIIKGVCSGTGTGYGITVNDTLAVVTLKNNVVYDWKSGGDSGFKGVYIANTSSTGIYQNTVYNCGYGIQRAAGTVTAKNSLAFGNNTDLYGTMTLDYNASDDDLSSLGDAHWVNLSPGATEADDWAAAMPNYASGNFAIGSTSSVLYNAGADLSGTVDEDILGVTRPQATTYDIGAFEWELAELAKATDPNAADGAVAVLIDLVLGWAAVDGADNYNIWLAPYDSPLVLVTNVDPNSYDPDLSYSTLYRWRVDPNADASGSVTGDVWQFRTVQPPAYPTPTPGKGPIIGSRIIR